jgi:DNA polymerase III alpha subunit
MPDIDIDFPDRDTILNLIRHTKSSRLQEDEFILHNTGIYVQPIPHNPITNLANIDYKIAEERGYFKIDFLNVALYKDVKNEDHLLSLMNTEPMWALLKEDDFIDLLFQVNGHGDILRTMAPSTIEELAAVLAIIRPAKRYLLGKDWATVMKDIWTRPDNDEYYFKKSHAIAYATAIVVQMNLICESISYDFS